MIICTLLVDVVVGEVQLTPPVSSRRHNGDPLCPIVGVQISNGPLLYFPFLTSDNIKTHLPLEVEESYLMGGKFVFHRGKSCLYTVPNVAVRDCGTTNHHNDILQAGRRSIKIVILNGLCVPPTVYGKCETFLTTDQAKQQQLLRGKHPVFNDKGELAAYLTISISCRILGEDVAYYTHDHNQIEIMDLGREKIPGLFPSSVLNKDKTVMPATVLRQECSKLKNYVEASVSKTGMCKDHNPLQPIEKLSVSCDITETDSTDLSQHCRLEQETNDFPSKRQQVHHCPSELIAMKIAEFKSNSNWRDDYQDNWNTSVINNGINFESHQPAPIVYTGHSVQAERLWNEKIKNLGDCGKQLTDSEGHNCGEPENIVYTRQKIKHKKKRNKQCDEEKQPEPLRSADIHKKTKTNLHHTLNIEQNRSPKSLSRPIGWLRTTPVATQQHCKNVPHPKLNRTSLLRKAKLDPQLAHQLQAEINYQVKQKLKCMDDGFEATLVKIQGRKAGKGHTGKRLSVGCQTLEDWRGSIQIVNEPSQKYTTHETLNLSNEFCLHEEVKGYMAHANKQKADTRLESNLEENKDVIYIRGERVAELQRNLTFDVDVTALQSNSKDDFNENYEEDFELSTDSSSHSICNTSDEKYFVNRSDPQAGIVANSEKRSPVLSMSISCSEPRDESKEQKSADIIQVDKLKFIDAKSEILIQSEKVMREPSQDTALTYTVREECPQQKENIYKDTTGKPDQYFTPQHVDSSPNIMTTSHSVASSLKPSDDDHSSQTSEVSEASAFSAEVFQEILKGRHADFLMRNGSHMYDSKRQLSLSTENSISEEHISTAGNISENSKSSRRYSMASDNLYNSEILSSIMEIDKPSMIGDSLIENIKSKSLSTEKNDVHNKWGVDKSEKTTSSSALEKCVRAETVSKTSSSCSYQGRSSPRGLDDVNNSITDISARIAALLMPRRVSLAHRNTDSISSYVPSSVSDTLSSLSDIAGE